MVWSLIAVSFVLFILRLSATARQPVAIVNFALLRVSLGSLKPATEHLNSPLLAYVMFRSAAPLDRLLDPDVAHL